MLSLSNLFTSMVSQVGGGAKNNSLYLFLLVVAMFLLKAVVVMWSWNEVAMKAFNTEHQLSYRDSLFLVILADALVR